MQPRDTFSLISPSYKQAYEKLNAPLPDTITKVYLKDIPLDVKRAAKNFFKSLNNKFSIWVNNNHNTHTELSIIDCDWVTDDILEMLQDGIYTKVTLFSLPNLTIEAIDRFVRSNQVTSLRVSPKWAMHPLMLECVIDHACRSVVSYYYSRPMSWNTFGTHRSKRKSIIRYLVWTGNPLKYDLNNLLCFGYNMYYLKDMALAADAKLKMNFVKLVDPIAEYIDVVGVPEIIASYIAPCYGNDQLI